LSTKIHTTVDARGNPIGFRLTEGQACELDGADVLPLLEARTVIADKGFDADKRVLEPLKDAGKKAIIPPGANRKVQREYDKELYKARHLIENFFAKLKLFRCITTRYDKTAKNFFAAIHLAATVIWLNQMTSPSAETQSLAQLRHSLDHLYHGLAIHKQELSTLQQGSTTKPLLSVISLTLPLKWKVITPAINRKEGTTYTACGIAIRGLLERGTRFSAAPHQSSFREGSWSQRPPLRRRDRARLACSEREPCCLL
jgi:transposase